MVLNYFDLGDIFYDSCKKDMLKRLQTLQNSALRCVFCNNKDLSITEMHTKANLQLLSERRSLNHCTIAHKYNIENFKFDNSKCPSLRSSNRISLVIPKARNRCFEKSFVLKSIKKWNSIPELCKRIPCDETKFFKTRVKKEMMCNKLNFPE